MKVYIEEKKHEVSILENWTKVHQKKFKKEKDRNVFGMMKENPRRDKGNPGNDRKEPGER